MDPKELERLKRSLLSEGVESVAVCFMHAYAYPEHEHFVGEYLLKELPQLQVSLSSEVLPERREYERSATTAVNAYVRPIMQGYLGDLPRGPSHPMAQALPARGAGRGDLLNHPRERKSSPYDHRGHYGSALRLPHW